MILKRTLLLVLASLAIFVWSGCVRHGEETVTVNLPAGTFVGLVQDGSASFKGIPYAAPVDNEFRFQPARPAVLPSGVTSAKEFGSPCAHLNRFNPDDRTADDFVDGPDCLNLNVWVPYKRFNALSKANGASDAAAEKIPVMVFIHGGAFDYGFTGWNPLVYFYEGARLAAAGDVIVVSLNYRLGALGFLYHPALASESGGAANLGIRDQMLALQWVQRNISAFGGDVNNVTVFGESAGAVSVCNLMLLPEAHGLFHKAIMQSGSCMLRDPDEALLTTEQVLSKLGCYEGKTSKEQAACLQEKESKEIVLAQPRMSRLLSGVYLSPPFGPVRDGQIFKDRPEDVISAGRHMRIPVLVGTNAREVPVWIEHDSRDQWESSLKELSPDAGLAIKIRQHYESRNRGSYQDLLADLKTDVNFTCRARRMAHLLASNQKEPVYLYLFEKSLALVERWFGMIGMPAHGSFHGMELVYLFRHIPTLGIGLPLLKRHQALQDEMTTLWAGFARTGGIKGDTRAAEWVPYQQARLAGIVGDFSGVLDDPRSDACELMESRLASGTSVGAIK